MLRNLLLKIIHVQLCYLSPCTVILLWFLYYSIWNTYLPNEVPCLGWRGRLYNATFLCLWPATPTFLRHLYLYHSSAGCPYISILAPSRSSTFNFSNKDIYLQAISCLKNLSCWTLVVATISRCIPASCSTLSFAILALHGTLNILLRNHISVASILPFIQ